MFISLAENWDPTLPNCDGTVDINSRNFKFNLFLDQKHRKNKMLVCLWPWDIYLEIHLESWFCFIKQDFSCIIFTFVPLFPIWITYQNEVLSIRVSSYPTCDPGGRLQNERIHCFVSLTERATYTFLPGLPRYERQSRCVWFICT